MSIDEDKIIDDIDKKSGDIKDYFDFIKLDSKYSFERRKRKIKFIFAVLVFYAFIAIVLLFTFRDNPDLLNWPFNNSENKEISSLKSEIDNLKYQVDSLKEKDHLQASNINNYLLYNLENRIDSLEETITLDPEKALTAVLIREKQKNLESNFDNLRNSQNSLNEKVDNFFLTVLLGPLVIALLGLITWIIKVFVLKNKD